MVGEVHLFRPQQRSDRADAGGRHDMRSPLRPQLEDEDVSEVSDEEVNGFHASFIESVGQRIAAAEPFGAYVFGDDGPMPGSYAREPGACAGGGVAVRFGSGCPDLRREDVRFPQMASWPSNRRICRAYVGWLAVHMEC